MTEERLATALLWERQLSAIWKREATLDELNKVSENTLLQHLEIEFVEIGDDYLKAQMPVNWKTHRPDGILHGGASVALAESTGSMAAYLCLEKGRRCVGLDINANHIRIASSGFVYCTSEPIHLGQRTQVWENKITNDAGSLVCQSRLTVLVLRPN